MKPVSDFFRIEERGSSIATEVRAGFTIFLTMAYILFVNPMILKNAGIPFEACVVSTAVAAGISCIVMGVFTNFPLALASGMGLNSVLAFSVILKHKVSWQVGMGLIVLDGLVVLTLVLVGLREAVMNAIPSSLKHATAVGIGLFLSFIGFLNGGIVVINPDTMLPSPGALATPNAAVAAVGLLIIAILVSLKIRGGILIGILVNTAIAFALGVAHAPSSVFSAPDFSLIGKADVGGAFTPVLLPLLIGIIIVDFFDTLGTVTAIGYQAKLSSEDGRIENANRILGVDALAAAIGGFCGASSVTSYIESAAGVSEGGRTGLTPVVTGLFFLTAVFIAPFAGIVPKEATAPALVIIGFMMMESISAIDFSNHVEAIPAFLTFLAMPFTYSISHGIGFGFISFVVLKVVSGKASEVHPLMYGVALVFALSFALIG